MENPWIVIEKAREEIDKEQAYCHSKEHGRLVLPPGVY
jgi:hypothetical protein